MKWFTKLPWLGLPDKQIISNRQFFKKFNGSKSLKDYSFVVLDTELTGLDAKRDEIISIGAVRVSGLQIDLSDTFHYYVRPANLEHTKATLVHKITPQQLKQAPPLSEVLPKFLAYIDTDILVGHYVGLDLRFLQRAMRRLLGGSAANPHIDTMRLAQIYRRLVLGHYHENNISAGTSYSLQALTTEFGLPFFDAHDALEDALQTAYLFLFLISKVQKANILTLADLNKAGRGINWATM